jgi:hypothetical protein
MGEISVVQHEKKPVPETIITIPSRQNLKPLDSMPEAQIRKNPMNRNIPNALTLYRVILIPVLLADLLATLF